MHILGIESTCDETSCAIVVDGKKILSNVINSQIDIQAPYGGVVPELASRHHIEVISKVVHDALEQADCTLDDIDVIAVAKGPGLIGALLVGIHYAQGLSWSKNIPLIGVNHIEAHLYSALMSIEDSEVQFPSLGVVLSGGHTSLVRIDDYGVYTLLGQTQDDAIGEAFDKVAKMLGQPYPGGPHIERLAKEGNPNSYAFRCGQMKNAPLDFSFSGIKTSVLYKLFGNDLSKTLKDISDGEIQNAAASFQHAAFSDIVQKIDRALTTFDCQALYFGGGVTQNRYLRDLVAGKFSLPCHFPPKELCLDNAAMIAGLGYYAYKANPIDEMLSITAKTRFPFVGNTSPTA